MSRHPWILCLALLCGAMTRQDPETDPSQEYSEFVRSVFLRDQRWEQVERPLEIAKSQRATEKAVRTGGGVGGKYLVPPRKKFLKTAQAKALQYKGTEHAVPWLVWVVSDKYIYDAGPLRQASATLMLRHLESPGIGNFARNLPVVSRRIGQVSPLPWLERILETNQHGVVQANALLARARVHLGQDAFEEARADAERAQALAEGHFETLALVAELIEDMNRPSVGRPAPEIEGQDLDGELMRLSDYRGKVVLLDFWGDW